MKILLQDSLYPYNLKSIVNPPKHLFYKCSFKLTPAYFKKCLAIVGSREISFYGKAVLDHLFKTLDKSITIVSGFMTGIDSYAHRLALSYGMKTIAILPNGVEDPYPKSNSSLYRDVLYNGGLVLSEYPENTLVKKWMFCRRNRIIAGVSFATLVIEASLNSGSINCAEYANSFGRKVFLTPGSIFRENSAGISYLANKYGVLISEGTTINGHFNSTTTDLFCR